MVDTASHGQDPVPQADTPSVSSAHNRRWTSASRAGKLPPLALLLALVPGCGCWELLLQDYSRDLLVAGFLTAALLHHAAQASNQDGSPPRPLQRDGIDCWDINDNRLDDPQEDVNGDGLFDARDCQGPIGAAGPQGPSGVRGDAGPSGSTGPAGADGADCWDTNGDGLADPDEDVNGDRLFDARDCQGPSGFRGPGGETGQRGDDGLTLFHVPVDDFFTAGVTPAGQPAMELAAVDEPVIGTEPPGAAALAFRVVVPRSYDPGNGVSLRFYFFRIGPPSDGCLVFTLDARRLRTGSEIRPYDHDAPETAEACAMFPSLPGCGRRWIRMDPDALLEEPDETGSALMAIDLPLNKPQGLDFPDDLRVADFLAFEINTYLSDGAAYSLLAAEFYESRPDAVALSGASIITSAKKISEIKALCTARLAH